jgi:hypothetical protein
MPGTAIAICRSSDAMGVARLSPSGFGVPCEPPVPFGLGVAFGGLLGRGVAAGAVARGFGVAVARGVGFGVGLGVGAGVGLGVGAGVGFGVGLGVGFGVGAGVGAVMTTTVGATVVSTTDLRPDPEPLVTAKL